MSVLRVVAALAAACVCLAGVVAQAQVRVTAGPGGYECIQIASGPHFAEGGCELRLASVGEMMLTVLGRPVSLCDLHLDSYTAGDGSGLSNEQRLNGRRCLIRPCTEGNSDTATIWSHRARPAGPREAIFDFRICVETTGEPRLKLACDVPFRAFYRGERYYRLEVRGEECGSSGVELYGTWQTNPMARIKVASGDS